MKKSQRLISLLIAALMTIVLAMSVMTIAEVTPVEAAAPSITIEHAAPGKTYRVYKIFDLQTSADATGYSYSIRNDSPWFTKVNEFAQVEKNGLVLTPIENITVPDPIEGNPDNTKIVTIYDVAYSNFTNDLAASLAAELKTYETNQFKSAAEGTLPVIANEKAATDGYYFSGDAPYPDYTDTNVRPPLSGITFTIPVDGDGYYFVSTSIGSLCILNTAAPAVTVVEKNTVPDIAKWIIDSNNSEKNSISARIFDGKNDHLDDIIKFRLTIAPNVRINSTVNGLYTVHDTYSNGLDLYPGTGTGAEKGTFTVQEVIVDASGDVTGTEPLNTSFYTIKYRGEEGFPEKCTTDSGEEMHCSFHIEFNQDFINTLTTEHADHRIRIEYLSTLNTTAVKNSLNKQKAPDGNSTYTEINKTRLEYGNNVFTEERWAAVNTYGFGIFKKDSISNAALDGAKFKLYLDSRCNTEDEIKLVKIENGESGYNENYNSFRPAVATDAADKIVPITTKNGYAEIYGLSDKSSCYLKEIQAPDGYNLMTSATPVNADDLKFATRDASGVITDYNSAVVIPNSKGVEIPSTGGMGTRLFYVFGGVLVIGAGILLITKRRMSNVK